MKRIYDYLLAALCLIAGVVIFILWYPQAENLWILLLFIALFFPPIPLTILFEMIHALTRHRQNAEQIALILNIISTALLFAFWVFVISVGGKQNLPLATGSVCTDAVITMLVAVKARIEKKMQPPV